MKDEPRPRRPGRRSRSRRAPELDLDRLIIDDPKRGVFRMHRRIFTDPTIAELEQERIFERCWIYAGHESEIAHPGDFRMRDVAGRPVFLVRDAGGRPRVFFNTCRHNGALVCREPSGNAKVFTCPFHGWSYNTRGELVGVPDEKAYPSLDRSELGLVSPRVESYRGFVFMNLDPNAESLLDYLAGAREYIDLVCDQSEAGHEIVEGTQLYHMRANWKFLFGNSQDGYHAGVTHRRYIEWLGKWQQQALELGITKGLETSRMIALGNGHTAQEAAPTLSGRPVARWVPMFGDKRKAQIEEKRREMEERFGPARAKKICDTSRIVGIFPNLIILDAFGISLRTFSPRSPESMDVVAWCLAPKDEDPEMRSFRLDNFLTFWGPGGFATPDDAEMLESCQRGFANREVEWSDQSRGMHREDTAPVTDEFNQRTFLRRWHALITQSPDRARRESKRASPAVLAR